MKKSIEHEVSSGNVFADLGLPDADELFIKAGIVSKINDLIDQKKLSQKAAAKFLNITQSKMIALSSGKLKQLSIIELFKFLNVLGQDVNINITPKIKTKKNAGININIPSIKKKKNIIHKESTLSNTISIQAKKRK